MIQKKNKKCTSERDSSKIDEPTGSIDSSHLGSNASKKIIICDSKFNYESNDIAHIPVHECEIDKIGNIGCESFSNDSNIWDETNDLNSDTDMQYNDESKDSIHDPGSKQVHENFNVISVGELYSNDIGLWPEKLPKCLIDYWVSKGSKECQHDDSDFTLSLVSYKNHNRFCRRQYFFTEHPKTKEKKKRTWLCYSEAKKKTLLFPMYTYEAFRKHRT